MLSVLWVVLSSALSLGQLLVLIQSDWIVHGPLSQGLFAVCYEEPAKDCQLRLSPLAVLVLGLNVLGTVLLLITTVCVIPFLICTNRARPIDFGSNAQMLAVVLTGISVIIVPFDLEDVLCSPNQLLQSTNCRIGWPYALACIFALISMCCPVLAKLIADQRKTYSFLHRKEWFM
ncbi:hypothetical protein L596_024072 [Steinernema carpocapsae]|uniref:G-protein coupled receptors family 1 profile domain-containing protein n=1 Tax=Steinernema carpocapsae TaxID=34508 RepID=A0A4U5MFV3_STECR|nr:hypothetical protein L596_024072 [Steinernema carpocapsae]